MPNKEVNNMNTIIKNIHICQGVINNAISFIPNGEIHIQGNTIVYAGTVQNAPVFQAEKIIDGENGIAMPGMVNLHTHTPMTMLRSVGGNLNLEDWLNTAIFPREAKLNDDIVYLGSVLGIMEMLRFGTTNFNDMYMRMDAEAKAVRDFKMRATLGAGAVSFVEEDMADYDQSLEFALKWNNQDNGRIKTAIAPHSCYLTTNSLFKQTSIDAHKYNLPIHIHISETQTEVATVKEKFGLTPTQVLDKFGLLDLPIIAAHCVWLTEEDIALAKKANYTVAHNPISNLKLASGIAPITKYIQEGIKIGLGTDGVASNNNLNLWEEMRSMPLLQKGVTLNPTVITPAQTLHAATLAGAKALGYENLGIIKEGYIADIALIDMNNATAVPQNSLEDDLIYALQGSDVFCTMVDGNVLYYKGEYPGFNKQEIFDACKKAARSLA